MAIRTITTAATATAGLAVLAALLIACAPEPAAVPQSDLQDAADQQEQREVDLRQLNRIEAKLDRLITGIEPRTQSSPARKSGP